MLVRLASPLLLLVSALDPSNHSRPRRTVSADCALPTYPVFVHAALIHTATFTRFLWDCPISLLRRKTHIRAYTPVTPRVASLSARRNDKRANIRTQMALFAYLCAHGRRFGAHLGTQIRTTHPTHEQAPRRMPVIVPRRHVITPYRRVTISSRTAPSPATNATQPRNRTSTMDIRTAKGVSWDVISERRPLV